MDSQLRSDNISLLFDDDSFGGHGTINELWQTFRRTAVEPGQASSPDFTSFADDCLLCAQIVINEPVTPAENEDDRSESLYSPEERTLVPQPSPSTSPTVPPSPSPESRKAGLIYLHSGPANLPAGEANIGVITKPDMQHRGYAREAVQLVLRWAFEELKFHRVQAAILDTPSRDRALRLFIGSGFAHEGTKRRAVYQPEGEGMAAVWRDVTYLAMLDTEWMLKSTWIRANRTSEPPVVSVWDEMFTRHAREREELVRWEEKHGRMKRSSSTETLRECTKNAVLDMAYLTDDASSFSGSSPPSPKPNVVVNWEEDAHMADTLAPDEHQRWEEVIETSLAARRHRQWMGSSSLDPSLLQGHMLALPSIPSTAVSERNLQSPLTIPSASTPGSTPPSSRSPSLAPSSVHSNWTDTEDEDEDEDNWLLREDLAPANGSIQFTTPHHSYPVAGPASLRTRSRSSSVSTTDSWSDAQSCVSASSSSWDLVSDASDRGHPLSL